ncbi:Unknown protein sequence [Pseudomonas syringae pv. maculicola]|nr:Unknown protein sequence [Pseudomonas syringae pv. maculicola]
MLSQYPSPRLNVKAGVGEQVLRSRDQSHPDQSVSVARADLHDAVVGAEHFSRRIAVKVHCTRLQLTFLYADRLQ